MSNLVNKFQEFLDDLRGQTDTAEKDIIEEAAIKFFTNPAQPRKSNMSDFEKNVLNDIHSLQQHARVLEKREDKDFVTNTNDSIKELFDRLAHKEDHIDINTLRKRVTSLESNSGTTDETAGRHLKYINEIADSVEQNDYSLYELYKDLSKYYKNTGDFEKSKNAKQYSDRYYQIAKKRMDEMEDDDLLSF